MGREIYCSAEIPFHFIRVRRRSKGLSARCCGGTRFRSSLAARPCGAHFKTKNAAGDNYLTPGRGVQWEVFKRDRAR